MTEKEKLLKLPLDEATCKMLKGDIDEEGKCVVRLIDKDEETAELKKIDYLRKGKPLPPPSE
ncbi:MAG: hypothetical protein QXG39_03325 [Candidatus Aenigmatarchaeota archaeon]